MERIIGGFEIIYKGVTHLVSNWSEYENWLLTHWDNVTDYVVNEIRAK